MIVSVESRCGNDFSMFKLLLALALRTFHRKTISKEVDL